MEKIRKREGKEREKKSPLIPITQIHQ